MTNSIDASGQATNDYPSPLAAWGAVIILLLAYTCSYVDRTIIALLVEPIKADLHLSDTDLGFLYGFAFALMYTVMGLPMGWIVDRFHRRFIIICGIFVWSLSTVGCAFARSFGQLFAWRSMVGVGEATLTPAADSLIADVFPRHRRASGFAVYHLGVALGSGLALFLGGTVIEFVGSADATTVPLLGVLKPWQLTFVVVGLPGLFIGLLMFLVREPKRHELYQGRMHLPFEEGLGFIYKRRGLYLALFLGSAAMACANIGFSAWIPTMMIRTYDWSAGDVGQAYGLITLTFGVTGAVATLFFGDRLLQRFDARCMGALYVVAGSFQFSAVMIGNANLTLALLTLPAFALGATPALSTALLQNVTPNQLRGQLIAMNLMVSAIIAAGFGPILPALLTDFVFNDENYIRHSLACIAFVLPGIGATLMLLASRRIPRALAEARSWSAGFEQQPNQQRGIT